jgi:hypothetical protein
MSSQTPFVESGTSPPISQHDAAKAHQKIYNATYKAAHKREETDYSASYYKTHQKRRKAQIKAYDAAHKREKRTTNKTHYKTHYVASPLVECAICESKFKRNCCRQTICTTCRARCDERRRKDAAQRAAQTAAQRHEVRRKAGQRESVCLDCGLGFKYRNGAKWCAACRNANFAAHHKAYNALKAELTSVRSHHHSIFKSLDRSCRTYKGMPFCDGWNPDKGGSFKAGSEWIITNIGKRPEGCSLHIVDHEMGFVPDNLEWAYPQKQSAQQMFKIIADQKHRIRELEVLLAAASCCTSASARGLHQTSQSPNAASI